MNAARRDRGAGKKEEKIYTLRLRKGVYYEDVSSR